MNALKFAAALFVLFPLASSSPTAPAYPLKKSANNRYLVDQNNVPFLMVGDSPQALIVNLTEAEAARYSPIAPLLDLTRCGSTSSARLTPAVAPTRVPSTTSSHSNNNRWHRKPIDNSSLRHPTILSPQIPITISSHIATTQRSVKTCNATTDALHAHDGNSTAAFVGLFWTQSHHERLSEGRLTDDALKELPWSHGTYALSKCWSRM